MTGSGAGCCSTELVANCTQALDGAIKFVSLFCQALVINFRLTVRLQHGGDIVQ